MPGEAATEARFYTDVDALQELVILLHSSLLPDPIFIGTIAHPSLKRVVMIIGDFSAGYQETQRWRICYREGGIDRVSKTAHKHQGIACLQFVLTTPLFLHTYSDSITCSLL